MNNELPEVHELSSRQVSRRELARTLLSGLAAGIVFPSLPPLHSVHDHMLDGGLLDSAGDVLASPTYKCVFLTEAQFACLEKITEAIVPGSHQAQSTPFLDLLLSVESTKSQQDLAASLAALEMSANQTFRTSIAALSDMQLNELLQTASVQTSDNYAHFENLKNWTVAAYYSSEIGMRELGWTPDRVFSAFPACTHGESHS